MDRDRQRERERERERGREKGDESGKSFWTWTVKPTCLALKANTTHIQKRRVGYVHEDTTHT